MSPVYGIAMHPDGSLVASSGLNSIVLVWDLRTGKQIWAIRDHVREVLTLDFAGSGSQLASGSADNQVRIFDLRQRSVQHTIAAHQVRFLTYIFQKKIDKKKYSLFVSCL